jgi:hypothetical protein
MPTAATVTAGGTRQGTGRQNDRAVMPTVPFIRASAPHREPAGIDVSRQFTTSDQDLGVFDVPAYGYVRSIILVVTASGGTGGSPVVTVPEDSPFCALKSISLTEPNGAILSQFSTGYHLHLAHKWGGYRHPIGADFKASPTYAAIPTTGASFAYMQRIPVEINLRDGLGSLPNQNAAATFKLRLTLAKIADVMGGTLPTTLPTVRVRVYTETWDQPEMSSGGATNQLTPPAMNTTQFWSEQVYNVNSGLQTIRLTRVGNYVRNLIMIFRATGGGTRATVASNFPDPLTILLDTRPLDTIELNNFRHQMYELTGFGGGYADAATLKAPSVDTPNGLDNSVWVYDFCHEFDGALGRENRDLWLPTLGSSRVELQGTFGAAGVLTILTNDVAIAGSVFL